MDGRGSESHALFYYIIDSEMVYALTEDAEAKVESDDDHVCIAGQD